MQIQQNVSLTGYTTMRLGGTAAYLTTVTSVDDIAEAVAWADERSLPYIMVGGGSNIIWADSGFPGLVMVNNITGVSIQPGPTPEMFSVTAGAGENWDSFVGQTVDAGLTGIEFLSLVPGTVGGTPVQNVGAYGQEVAKTILTVQAYDTQTHAPVTIHAADCAFGYRTSIFKTTARGRYLITNVTFFLSKGNPLPPFYGAIEAYCAKHAINPVTPAAGRAAVIDIRSRKLPDPAQIANNGSFFGNPIIEADAFFKLQPTYPNMVHWWVDSTHIKLSAAWLIEHAGFKDYHDPTTGMATWPAQPLVLINEHAPNTAALQAFTKKITDAVHAQFGITLIQEPEILPHA